jgi:5'-methylthioadenosine phosphorylase
MSSEPCLGIIGGSGLYDLQRLTDVKTLEVNTVYGKPSSAIVSGRLGGIRLLFLARHGRGHHIAPHQLNFRANICALKQLGATQLLAVSAVGSMLETIAPGHVVLVDQFLDLTRQRSATFFDNGIVAHVSFADPVCPELSAAAADAAVDAGAVVHRGGTYVCIDGPQFSTRAESELYRSWGCSVIGMTAMPEAKLAREAELPYALMAMATDYDCWHKSEEAVNVKAVVAVLQQNASTAQRAIAKLTGTLPDPALSPASHALTDAIITAREAWSPDAAQRLAWLLDR